jgi:hypothetical protein
VRLRRGTLIRHRVKTVTHVVELLNFVQNRIRMHGVQLSLVPKQPVAELPKVRGRRVRQLSLGKTELTALPRDMFTQLYAALATLWKVEVTASNV